jgi:hypothetical protein
MVACRTRRHSRQLKPQLLRRSRARRDRRSKAASYAHIQGCRSTALSGLGWHSDCVDERRNFQLDRACGGEIIASIEDPAVIKIILAHLTIAENTGSVRSLTELIVVNCSF